MNNVKNCFNLIIEGPDAVGKSTLIDGLFKYYNFRYMCYHRGELSNYVFAKKFNRPFFATQRGLPFIYIYLHCDEEQLRQRAIERAKQEYLSDMELEHELEKIDDAKLFDEAAEKLSNDYTIWKVDTTYLTAEGTLKRVVNLLEEKFMTTESDVNLTSWNQMYDKACKQLGLKFKVIDNQPYIDGVPMMVESTCHNGTYETFDSKEYPDNLIYAYGYGIREVDRIQAYDFNYIINSKIKQRLELFDYFERFDSNGLSCIVSDNPLIPQHAKQLRVGRLFGQDYLDCIARSKATVYCARDLAYLELQTARLYESIIANNIVFVDEQSDPDCKILKSIHKDNPEVIDCLYVTPHTICNKYNFIMANDSIRQSILKTQHAWLNALFDKLEDMNNDRL